MIIENTVKYSIDAIVGMHTRYLYYQYYNSTLFFIVIAVLVVTAVMLLNGLIKDMRKEG